MHATVAEIRVAYKKMALKFHPDKNKEAGSAERFKMVSGAKEILLDAAERRKYDVELDLKMGAGRPARW